MPTELELHSTLSDAGKRRLHDAVFLAVGGREVAPVQTRVVCWIGVPGFGDVDFAVGGPGEGFRREEPEGRPDSCRAWGGDDGGETAGGAGEFLM